MRRKILATAAAALAAAVGLAAAGPPGAGVDAARLRAAEANAEWLSYGRTYSEQRFSPLTAINAGTVGRLGLAWSYEFDTDRGQEATPVVVDGLLITTTAWSKVFAFDARTGALRWSFDPKVDGAKGFDACCDVVNRGVAVWKGRVFVGALDGRLIALDAGTGAKLWDVQTTDTARPYTITGAPRVVKGKVIIGNGGAEYGVRGYVSAYDAQTGKLAWRFFTTPDPAGKPDGAASDGVFASFAGATWFGEGWKQTGGGGTAWDAMAYDPDLDILYVGVGNGTPWNHQKRSDGKGDNLFLSSILALKPDSGAYVWHYQTTPGESWDYTATQHIMLADLPVGGGKPRRVVMQAPKNGFFYVLDARRGTLLSAEKYVPVNWAERVDPKSGRPVENPKARYLEAQSLHITGPLGGHNWQPMAYDPKAGLVFIPAMVLPGMYSNPKEWTYAPGLWNTGQGGFGEGPAGQRAPDFGVPTSELGGRLIAWDPVAGKARWSVRQSVPWNSGLLSAGGLVFGGFGKDLKAYAVADGKEAWRYPVGVGVIASPMTYAIDGEQYLAVMAGFGGAGGMGSFDPRRPGRLLVFKLDATGKLPPLPAIPPRPRLDVTTAAASTGDPKAGANLYGTYCGACHSGGGYLPVLQTSPMLLEPGIWRQVVYDGALRQNGMAGFKRFLTPDEVEHIRAYFLDQLKPKR